MTTLSRRRWPSFSAVTTSFACCFALSAFAEDGTLIVANRTGGSISLIDLAEGIEIARIPIGPVVPHEVDVSPDGQLALTAEYGPNDSPGRHVVVIDVATATIKGRIDLGPNSRPHTALFLPDGQRAVATMQDSDQLALLDVAALRVLKTFPTGGREGHLLRLSPDGTRAYVTSRGAEGTLSVVYLDEDRAPDVIVTGRGAEGLDVTADGREIWVANRVDASLSIVDAQSLKIVATLPLPPSVGRIDIGPNGLAVMPDGPKPADDPAPQMLRVWDTTSRAVTNEIPMRDGTPRTGGFGLLIRGDSAYLADQFAGTIQKIALDGSGERELLVTHHERPDGVAWTPIRVSVLNTD